MSKTDWFRSWHGAPTDPKWRTIARRAGVRPCDVVALVWLLMDRASQAVPRGSIAGYDAEVIADALGHEPEDVERIIAAMRDKGVLEDESFAAWQKYQPAREDGASERAREWRERNRTHANANERNRTKTNVREEKIREEKIREESSCEILVSESRAFPTDGSIHYGPWGEIVRQQAPGVDVDRIASQFRKFCHSKDIDFDAPFIEKTFRTFCQKARVRA